MPAYDGNPAHGFLAMLDPANGLAPGDPARMELAGLDPDRVPPHRTAWPRLPR